MDVDVFLAGWEIECCQPPPGEGDVVSWPLLWVDDPVGPGAQQIAWRARSLPADGDAGVLHLVCGPVNAWWHRATGTAVPARGCLWADTHGGTPEQVPLTRGRVLTVHVVEQAYQRTTGACEPVPGDFELRQVSRSPRWFRGDLDRPPDRGPLPDLVHRQSGVLVGLHLETPGG